MDLCLTFSFTASILFLGAGGGEITWTCSSSSSWNAVRSLVHSRHGRWLKNDVALWVILWVLQSLTLPDPSHLWGPRLYFCCSSSLSNSYCWDSLLCQISLLGRFPSKNETRLTLLIHVLFNHSWKEEMLFVRCNIDPATLQVIWSFPRLGQEIVHLVLPLPEHIAPARIFSVEAHSL